MTKYKRVWFPGRHGICVVDQPRKFYLHSVFVGLTAPILNMPIMLVESIVLPLLAGVVKIVSSVVISAIAGLAGKVAGLDEIQEGILEEPLE